MGYIQVSRGNPDGRGFKRLDRPHDLFCHKFAERKRETRPADDQNQQHPAIRGMRLVHPRKREIPHNSGIGGNNRGEEVEPGHYLEIAEPCHEIAAPLKRVWM